MNKKIIKDTLILFVITLISGILLGGAYYITKDPIEQKENEKEAVDNLEKYYLTFFNGVLAFSSFNL